MGPAVAPCSTRYSGMCFLNFVHPALICPRAHDRDGQRQRVNDRQSDRIAAEETSSSSLGAGIVLRRRSDSLTTCSSVYYEPGSTPEAFTTQSQVDEQHGCFTASQYIADCILKNDPPPPKARFLH
jgi:hypothetical protein